MFPGVPEHRSARTRGCPRGGGWMPPCPSAAYYHLLCHITLYHIALHYSIFCQIILQPTRCCFVVVLFTLYWFICCVGVLFVSIIVVTVLLSFVPAAEEIGFDALRFASHARGLVLHCTATDARRVGVGRGICPCDAADRDAARRGGWRDGAAACRATWDDATRARRDAVAA